MTKDDFIKYYKEYFIKNMKKTFIKATNNIRLYVVKSLCVFVIALVIFYGLDDIVTPQLYLLVSLSVFIAIFLSFIWSPHALIRVAGFFIIKSLSFGVAVTFLSSEYPSLHLSFYKTREIFFYMTLGIFYLAALAVCILYCLFEGIRSYIANNKRYKPSVVLLSQQRYDLERLGDYIKGFNIIGVCAAWGTGKSFILAEFVEEAEFNNTHYSFIHISLLSCNLDELQGIIMHEIDKLLFRSGVFSQYSKKLSDALGNTGPWAKVKSLVWGNADSFSVAIKSVGKTIEKSGKTVIIIYEDIDRIDDAAVIRKIFGISELIACDNIKIVYQYDRAELLKKDGLDRNFTEKFIPHTINISPINFYEAVQHLFKHDFDIRRLQWHLSNPLVDASDFSYIVDKKETTFRFGSGSNEKIDAEVTLPRLSMRTIKNFLQEAILFMLSHMELIDNKTTIISTFIVKHFYEKVSLALEARKDGRFNLLSTLTFEDPAMNNKVHTVNELILMGKNSGEKNA